MIFSLSARAGLLVLSALAASATAAITPAPAPAAASTPPIPKPEGEAAQLAFFEKNIRPVLASKCYKCHSAESEKVKGGLLLDTRDGIRQGGDSGHAVVPGNVKDSVLLKSLHWADKDLRMPPEKEGGKLPDNVIADFERWIAMGAADPRTGAAGTAAKKTIDWEQAKNFWSFVPPKAAPAPAVRDRAWPRTEVDRFILAAQEAKGLHPVGDAEKAVLARRAYFDLLGLPPSPGELEKFVQDASPDAFAKLVDRLLASPQFGERWGRHWLDVARYGESTGKERNFTYPTAWRYRDYVIDALNADKPYDVFVREQIAGDLLPARDEAQRREQLLATGFLALGPKSLQEKNPEQFKMDQIDEQIDTTTRAVLGLTVACARCHDHKFDPVPQKDYYALAGIFRSTETLYGTNFSRQGNKARNGSSLINLDSAPTAAEPAAERPAPNLSPEDQKRLAKLESSSPEKAARMRERLAEIGSTAAKKAAKSSPPPAPPRAAPKLSAKEEQRLAEMERRDPQKAAKIREMLAQRGRPAGADAAPAAAPSPAPAAEPAPNLTADEQKRLAQLERRDPAKAAQIRAMLAQRGNGAVLGKKAGRGMKNGSMGQPGVAAGGDALCMGVKEALPFNCRLLIRGEISQPGEPVPRGFVTILAGSGTPELPSKASGRLELVDWLTSEQNPLTARVAVNRLWQHLFGQGLVRTPDNLGASGETPSHPELLDALAVQFMSEGWSVKKLIRSLMLSRTYQLANAPDAKGQELDPDNRLLWQASQRRLDAEAIRDAMLSASGQLDLTRPKGSVVGNVGDAYIGKGVRPETFTDVKAQYRSVYLPIVRDYAPEVLELFDFAEPSLVVAARDVTNVPAQALYLMNNSFVREQSAALAKRILAAGQTDAERIAAAYRHTLGRAPTDPELNRAAQYLQSAAVALAEPAKAAPELPWSTFCQALFACAEFRYLR
jgi:cytochrome c553